jgi:hypothetical protein
MDRNAARHLVHNYGDRAHLVAAIADSGFNKPLHPKYQFIEAEVIYAIDFECAATAVDALARRTRLAFLDRDAAFEALPKVMMVMVVVMMMVIIMILMMTMIMMSVVAVVKHLQPNEWLTSSRPQGDIAHVEQAGLGRCEAAERV